MPVSRLCRVVLAALSLALAVRATAGVIPSRNVNMVSGTSWPDGDPFLQRQNEGSIAASTRNPLHLLAGGNDYRTVDIPGMPGGRMTGDAWLGVFWSRDGGSRWSSTLLPGYPQDDSPAGLASPLKGLEAGADAVLRAGTNGLVYYAGIAFNRAAIPDNAHGTGKLGKLFVARFIDDNAKETGSPFRYVGTAAADQGNDERFLDKPWLAVDVPRLGAGQCTIPASGAVPAQSFKAGNVYLSYTAVSGDPANLKTRLLFTRSRDCGATFSAPIALTDGTTVDQGTVIAVHPLTGWVYVAWRRLDPVTRSAAFLIAISIDGGRSFTRPIEVQRLAPYTLSDGATKVASVFEQGTSLVSFRTTGFPALAVDALGIVYVAWSERGIGPGGDARIVVKRSPGGLFWWWGAEAANRGDERGHELMPSLLFHAGKLLLIHYTLAEDHTVGVLTPVGDGTFTESRERAGDLADPADPSKVFREFVADAAPGGLKRRHTMDVWVRAAEPPLSCDLRLAWNASTRVSQYVFGDTGESGIRQFQFNPPNLPLFSCAGVLENCRAFVGDYVDLAAGPAFVPKGPFWTYNLDPRTAQTVHAVWTDNRDVRPPPPGRTWADYTPPFSPFSDTLGPQSLFDPAQARPVCVPGDEGFTTAGMRNQNLYTSRLTEGLVVGSPQNAKPLGFATLPGGQTVLLQRSFVVVVQNTSAALKTFRLRIRNQPPDGGSTGKASFLQFPEPGLPDPLTELFVNVGAKSSATRTVFVTSTSPDATITVDVQQATAPGGDVIPPGDGGLQASVVLNPDITNPDITNPDITNPDITNPDITNAEVYNPDITNPDITNPDITNPDITNPDITNPDITNPDITNPDITNVQVMNPDITNPDITNPDITNPDITNPDITNPDITNVGPGSYTDATWTVKDEGNTTGGYKVKLLMNGTLPPGFRAQLILHRGHSTPVAVGCELAVQRQAIVVANIVDPVFVDPLSPDITNPDITNPDITNATVYVGPGDDWVQATLRLFDPDPTDDVTAQDVLDRVTPVIVSQAVNTIEAAAGSRTPPVAVPDARTVVFAQPPARGSAGVPLSPPVRVQVRDQSGAVVPGALVTLSLDDNPTGATLAGASATTDQTGVATFALLSVDRAGAGYTLRASVGEFSPAVSRPFTILEACAADGAPSVSRYVVGPPGFSTEPLASREARDFDGDGDPDLAVVHGDGTVTKMAGDGLGAFTVAHQLTVPATPRALAVGDFNEDGLSDLAIASTTANQLVLVLSDADRPDTFFTASTATTLALPGGPSALATGDFNGDGLADLAVTLETSGDVAVLLGEAGPGFLPPALVRVGRAPMAIATGAFDAGAGLDLVVAHLPADDPESSQGRVSLVSGDGLGGFALTTTTATTGTGPTAIAAGDLTGGAGLDVAVAHQGSQDVQVMVGNGTGGFGAGPVIALGASPRAVAAGDFDADGHLDLATANGTADTVALIFSDGTGKFRPPVTFVEGPEPVDVAAGDFNQDGRADLVVTNRFFAGECCDNVAVVISSCGATTADLAVQLSDAPDPVAAGGTLTYTAVVTNEGPFAAPSVALTQEVPGPVQAVSPSTGDCTPGPPVVCALGTLAPGQGATVTVAVTAPAAGGAVSSQATASAGALDPRPADNTAIASTAVASGPRLLLVTTTADGGGGSLRQAILDSNASPGVRDTIRFALGAGGPHVIGVGSALPIVDDPVVIDATVEGGCDGSPPRVQLDGADAGTGVFGLVLRAGNSAVRGLSIVGFDLAAVFLNGAGGNVVECNYLGLEADGATGRANNEGVLLSGSAGNTIGGPAPRGNAIAAGRVEGVHVLGASSTGNVIAGNRIGTNAAGTAAVGNARGVVITDGSNNVVGGLAAGEGNLISGNRGNGVQVTGAATGNLVAGNRIGTDVSGSSALPNGAHGVEIVDAGGNVVGGRSDLARNVISGNALRGVRIAGASAAGNRVQGNLIGTDAAGTAALGNAGGGVDIDLGAQNVVGVLDVVEEANVISANGQHGVRISGGAGNAVNGNFIGIDEARQRALGNALSGISFQSGAAGNAVGTSVQNHIANNGESGIELSAGAGTGNRLWSNRLHDNGGLGIDLGGDGPTPNDPADRDGGPNSLQNTAVLSGASTGPGGTRVMGSFQTTPLTPLVVMLHGNAACDPSGFGEAEFPLVGVSGSSNANGDFFIDATFGVVAVGTAITAVVTTTGGAPSPDDTSEISNCVTVVSSAVPDGFTKVWVGGTAGNETGWTGASNWSPEGVPTDTDDVYIQPTPDDPLVNTGGAITRNLTVAEGARLSLGGFTLAATGHVDAAGAMAGPGTLRMAPAALGTLRGAVPALSVEGLVMPGGGGFAVLGDLGVVSGGTLDPGNQVVTVGGAFSTSGTGILKMGPGAALFVAGDALFAGGSTEDALVAGTLRVGGSFTQSSQTSPASFSASAGHLTILDGPGAAIAFATPGDRIGTSHFGALELQMPGDVSLSSAVFGTGPLITRGPTAPIVLGRGQPLTFAGVSVFRLVLDDAFLSSAGGTLSRFDDVTFQNFGSKLRMSVAHPGAAQPFPMSNVDFGLVTPAEGLLAVTDTAPADGVTLALALTGASPANGCPLTFRSGATVTWNGVPCGQ